MKHFYHRFQISDHRRFNMTRLDENRNQIMNITLIMEVCMLGIGTGTLISGIFGNENYAYLTD
jgi:hypothetical protein